MKVLKSKYGSMFFVPHTERLINFVGFIKSRHTCAVFEDIHYFVFTRTEYQNHKNFMETLSECLFEEETIEDWVRTLPGSGFYSLGDCFTGK